VNILVTGGAGYVGSIVVEELIKHHHQIIVLDKLSQGHREAVLPGAEFLNADLCNAQALDSVFHQHEIEAVMHLAAETVVMDSFSDPQRFFQNNVIGSIILLDAMLKNHVNKIIFSSSAAVYGEHDDSPILEEDYKVPVNAYGDSKLIFEGILLRYEKAYGIKYICLRYFNAAGATERLGEDHRPETHLIPAVLKAALMGNPITIFGRDYVTVDGTCVRDFVHVEDIARAHVLALNTVDEFSGRVFNLGNQRGYSILEVVNMAREITRINIPCEFSSRRPGDPAILIANSTRARQDLGWKPELSGLNTIITSAWDWIRRHPDGYQLP
jgi:UDP-glucose 4-epimerase